jgi:FMN phosphatase YigB (HAD superfamily)
MQLLCDDDNLEWLYWRAALGFEPEPNVHDGLDAIRTAGVRTALVSNTSFGPESIRRELALHGLADFFVSPIVTSARYGVRKPHPAILQAARGTFAADREVAWYVGNSVYHDLGASNAAGLTAVWYNEDGDELESSAANGERADVEVSGWLELAELIVALPKRRG